MSKIIIDQFIVGPVQTNCYFATNSDTRETIVIDPGDSGTKLAELARELDCHPVAILLTHGHFDHTDGIKDFRDAFSDIKLEVYAHEDEKELLADPSLNLSSDMGFGHQHYKADHFLKDGQILHMAGYDITVLHTPGHTRGGVCYYIPDEGVLFSGDTLFCGSIGRTDFPNGSASQLINSIKEKCLTLPDDTKVYPGHDSTTVIGDEKKYNFFLR